MALVCTFSLGRVNSLRERANRAAKVPVQGPRGWTPLGNEPAKLLKVFKSLRLRAGFALRGYQFRSGDNGNAFVYAMPVDQALPEPDQCPVDETHFLEPPVPPGSLANVMEAINGDGTPWSYLSATLFARELSELGALWHGCDWGTHIILGGNPLSKAADCGTLRRSREVADVSNDPAAWIWKQQQPDAWLPTAKVSEGAVLVTVYTFSGLGQETIYRHVDRYQRGYYCFQTRTTEVAKGPCGYVF